jgi:lipopolysaccharide/colanic/teichoic acid biosynthesis glycosyltransferase
MPVWIGVRADGTRARSLIAFRPVRVVHAVGARPNFVKLGPRIARSRADSGPRARYRHASALRRPHVSQNARRPASPKPDELLGVSSGPHGQQTARALEASERVLLQQRPDLACVGVGLLPGDSRPQARVQRGSHFGGVVLVTLVTLRSLLRQVAHRVLRPQRVLIVGEGESVPVQLPSWRRTRSTDSRPSDCCGPGSAANGDAPLQVLGDLQKATLRRVAAAHGLERIIVPQDGIERGRLLQLLHEAKELSIQVSLLPHVFAALGTRLEVDEVEGVTALGINPRVLSRSSRALKRTMDIVGAGVALASLSPILLCAAIAIKLDSRGPVLFRQQRVGKGGGRRFRMVKLRTMVSDVEGRMDALREHSADPHWLKLDHEPRVVRVGRVLRHTSVDKLPQLWNVRRGEMSLVGRRPLIEADGHGVDGWVRSRLDLTRGITGPWQLLGRTNIPFAEMVDLDYVYVTNWSLWNDVRLILRTLPVVVSQRGAN